MSKDEKQNFFLDLDATIIHSEPVEDYDVKQNRKKAKKFIFHNMDGYYVVFERPGLQNFLTYIFDNFNVSVWTAATKDYALFIIDKVIIAGNSNRKIDYIFFNYHCDICEKIYDHTKYLQILKDKYNLDKFHLDKTFILDDYDEVHKKQINNCIIAEKFDYKNDNSENDDFLKRLTDELRKHKNDDDKNIPSVIVDINKTLAQK
jgi:hypothetical protein